MIKTVDVEIKTVRRFFIEKNFREHAQRDRRLRKVGLQAVKWTTEGAGKKKLCIVSLVFCDVKHTSVAGDMLVSYKGIPFGMKQGGTAGKEDNHPVLDRIEIFCLGRDFLILRKFRPMN